MNPERHDDQNEEFNAEHGFGASSPLSERRPAEPTTSTPHDRGSTSPSQAREQGDGQRVPPGCCSDAAPISLAGSTHAHPTNQHTLSRQPNAGPRSSRVGSLRTPSVVSTGQTRVWTPEHNSHT
ncbi:unnamed protein product [Pleuronectes platessa]|uniref:Uncharacterized protein n=1 Tax=Pleuronectes platessa TaxID=8262 RepID=A0A9N7UCJ9_PLEPL|nr:unnamed protein product [Pleuronectes platessa]